MGTDPLPEKPLRSEVLSIALTGLVATLVSIVVTIEAGSSTVELIGLAEASVRDTKARVLSALARLGKWLDGYKVMVEFSPAGTRNDGMLDLAVATALLMALEQKPLPRTIIFGELALTGAVRPVRGVLPALLGVKDMSRAIVPWSNGPEASSVQHMEVQVAAHLQDVAESLRGTGQLQFARDFLKAPPLAEVDLADIQGLVAGRRALELSAAGLHPLLFIGSPGSGKTMLCRRLPTVMPPLTREEALEVTSIHSVAGLLHTSQGLITQRPLQAPHYTVSEVGLVGGGLPVRPGQVSLAHLGVLFLDELLEFKKRALAVLDGVLKDGQSVVCQRQTRVVFPARPLTVASVLPCPCGFHGTKDRTCKCPPERIRAYRERLRGAVLDRMDMKAILSGDELKGSRSECSADMRARVVKAREEQKNRFEKLVVTEAVNGRLSLADLDRVAKPDDKGQRMLGQAVERVGLSAELHAKVLRVSRTIADLDGSDAVRAHHIAEALNAAPLVT
ncbi:YifB family Mg chelatase-like AAA ATPase [Polyangium mundeleinium]|uniref:YifB family Mg chelatase-like AAA ATPase n=1 Tax=Polyangium mundeleinium TaxID=2995306 RepID=A0ABT5EP14_9BACT|nr:YifB family Mg chelatase-like AAA ATPase [Polyangium mundeleinium]MDC0743199.1 YifB family Mg chelatase-like AAA ATPase [Polyangium mundeleinium]